MLLKHYTARRAPLVTSACSDLKSVNGADTSSTLQSNTNITQGKGAGAYAKDIVCQINTIPTINLRNVYLLLLIFYF